MEIGAMIMMLKEGMFCILVLEDMHVFMTHIFDVLTDNQSGRDTVVNQGATKGSIHFERWQYYARELYLQQKIKPILVSTEAMRADDKTKVVHKSKFMFCRKMTMNLPDDV